MKRATLKKVLKELKPYSAEIGFSFLLAVVSVVSTLYVPILIGDAVDCFVGDGVRFDALLPILGRMGGVIAVTAVSQWFLSVLNNRIVYHVAENLRVKLFRHLMKLPLSYLDRHASGDLSSRMIADIDQLSDGLLMGFTQLFTGALTILGTLVFMLTVNVYITIGVVLMTPLSVFLTRFIAKKSHRYFEAQAKSRGEETAFIHESVTHEKVIKAYQLESKKAEAFDAIDKVYTANALKAVFYSSLVNPSTRFLNALIYALVGTFGALSVIATGGAFTVGALTCFLTYAAQYGKPFNEISGVVTELQNAFVSADRVFEVLEAEAETETEETPKRSDEVRGEVTFENVSFSYVPEKPLIRSFNLNVAPGQHIAIVGRTGCGKTTLINLLMRFYDVKSGRITVDGVPTNETPRKTLRAGFGMVLQDTWIMAGTVRENIMIGRPGATEEEMIEAAKKAHADGFIRRMPNGYDTVLPENGDGLSEGQKQLISIARVMLKLPPMLILDEATSSIDTRTEMKIQDAFAHLMEGRTSFIVAHRLSTIRNADRILVMEDGNIKETGTHGELMEKKGIYARLYESQFRGVKV